MNKTGAFFTNQKEKLKAMINNDTDIFISLDGSLFRIIEENNRIKLKYLAVDFEDESVSLLFKRGQKTNKTKVRIELMNWSDYMDSLLNEVEMSFNGKLFKTVNHIPDVGKK